MDLATPQTIREQTDFELSVMKVNTIRLQIFFQGILANQP